jgi:hypothetical protein
VEEWIKEAAIMDGTLDIYTLRQSERGVHLPWHVIPIDLDAPSRRSQLIAKN